MEIGKGFLRIMHYLEFLKKKLAKPEAVRREEVVLDLFAGCGGLALGFEAAGFKTVGFEKLKDACDTYNKNLLGECQQIVWSRTRTWSRRRM